MYQSKRFNWTSSILAAILVGLLILAGCSTVNETPAFGADEELSTAITYGEVDTALNYPHVGAGVRIRDDGAFRQFCSGTLIHPRVFLTAGHCTAFLEWLGTPVENVKVNFDLYALNEDTLLDVVQVITHPFYGSPGWASNFYDVGVLILENPVTDITPATLPSLGFLDGLRAEGKLHTGPHGTRFTVVGYGVQEWEAPGFSWDGLRRVAVSRFLNLRKAWLHLSQNGARSDSGTCFGDSGGPTFYTQADGSDILVSVTSWGDDRCVATGTTYRLDIPESLSFIEAVIQGLE